MCSHVHAIIRRVHCRLPVCTAVRSGGPSVFSVPSPRGPIPSHSRCKVGSHSHPNPPKAPLSFPAGPYRCSPGPDDSLSSAGLSSSCVALRPSAGGFPPRGHSCSYALNNTGSVFRGAASLRSAKMNSKTELTAICAAATTDVFMFLQVERISSPSPSVC